MVHAKWHRVGEGVGLGRFKTVASRQWALDGVRWERAGVRAGSRQWAQDWAGLMVQGRRGWVQGLA